MSGRDKGEKSGAGGVNRDRWHQNVMRVMDRGLMDRGMETPQLIRI